MLSVEVPVDEVVSVEVVSVCSVVVSAATVVSVALFDELPQPAASNAAAPSRTARTTFIVFLPLTTTGTPSISKAG